MIMMMMLCLVQSLVELYNYMKHTILVQHGTDVYKHDDERDKI